jgi:hypothetical protein
MTGTTAVCALLGGALGAAESVPYLRDTWRRTTVPHRGSWLIWGVIEVVAVESQCADGARWSLIPLIAQALGTCLVLALAIKLGSGGLSRVELTLVALAGAGVLGWLVADEPVIATTCVIVADFVAALMMLPKAWNDPGSETVSTYALAALAGVSAVGSVAGMSLPLLMYPVYFALVNAVLALVIVYRRHGAHDGQPRVPHAAIVTWERKLKPGSMHNVSAASRSSAVTCSVARIDNRNC